MPRWRPTLVVVSAYAVMRILDLLVFAAVADRDRLPVWGVLASWDGGWYQQALREGWPASVAVVEGVLQQSTWAWPPVFPMLGRLVAMPFGGDAAAGGLILINVIAGAGAAVVLHAALRRPLGERGALLTAIAWASMPAAPVLLMAYAEGVFLLLVFTAMWAALRNRLVLAGTILVVAGLTKSSVLPFAAALIVVALLGLRGSSTARVRPVNAAVASLLAVVSVAAWPVVVALALGSPAAYGDVQEAWGRSTIPGLDTLSSIHGLVVDPRVDILAGLLVTAAAVVAGIVVWRDRRFPLFVRVVGIASPLFLIATGAALSSARLLLPDPAMPGLAWRLMRGTAGIVIVLALLTVLRGAWIALYVSGVSGDPPP